MTDRHTDGQTKRDPDRKTEKKRDTDSHTVKQIDIKRGS